MFFLYVTKFDRHWLLQVTFSQIVFCCLFAFFDALVSARTFESKSPTSKSIDIRNVSLQLRHLQCSCLCHQKLKITQFPPISRTLPGKSFPLASCLPPRQNSLLNFPLWNFRFTSATAFVCISFVNSEPSVGKINELIKAILLINTFRSHSFLSPKKQ